MRIQTTTAWPQQQPTVKATPLLKTTRTITGQKLEYPGKNPHPTMVEIPPGVDVGWHEYPNIRYVYLIDGALSIALENGTRHHGMNAGSTPTRVLFIDHSEEGQSNMVKTEPPGPHHEGQDDHH